MSNPVIIESSFADETIRAAFPVAEVIESSLAEPPSIWLTVKRPRAVGEGTDVVGEGDEAVGEG